MGLENCVGLTKNVLMVALVLNSFVLSAQERVNAVLEGPKEPVTQVAESEIFNFSDTIIFNPSLDATPEQIIDDFHTYIAQNYVKLTYPSNQSGDREMHTSGFEQIRNYFAEHWEIRFDPVKKEYVMSVFIQDEDTDKFELSEELVIDPKNLYSLNQLFVPFKIYNNGLDTYFENLDHKNIKPKTPIIVRPDSVVYKALLIRNIIAHQNNFGLVKGVLYVPDDANDDPFAMKLFSSCTRKDQESFTSLFAEQFCKQLNALLEPTALNNKPAQAATYVSNNEVLLRIDNYKIEFKIHMNPYSIKIISFKDDYSLAIGEQPLFKKNQDIDLLDFLEWIEKLVSMKIVSTNGNNSATSQGCRAQCFHDTGVYSPRSNDLLENKLPKKDKKGKKGKKVILPYNTFLFTGAQDA